MACSRREFCVAVSVLVAGAPLAAQAPPQTLPSAIYNFDQLPKRQVRTALERAIFDGRLYEGCDVSLHESVLDPMSEPHPPHQHRHEEMVFVAEGELEFTVDGKATRCGEGSVLFAGSNDMHGIRNPTSRPARYFVLALGPGKN